MRPKRREQTAPLLVSEVMSTPVLTVRSAATGHEAVEMMRQRRIQHLVVVDPDGHVEGVVSDRDLRSAQPSLVLVPDKAMRDRALSLLRVSEIMTRQPYTVTPETPVAVALEHMLESKVGSVPVVEHQGRPVGILTGFDVVVLALRLLGEPVRLDVGLP